MTLPDDHQFKKEPAASSGSEEMIANAVEAEGVVANAADNSPPAGYQLLSTNAPIGHIENEDSDFEASTDSDSDFAGDPSQLPEPSQMAAVQMNFEWNDEQVVEVDESHKPQGSSFERHTQQEVAEVWTATNPTEILKTDDCNEIKQCLSSFQLPAENIPSWASEIPEGQWKDVLMERLKKMDKSD